MNPAAPSTSPPGARLLAIVEVPVEQKVLCQEIGCGRGVWKAIHVVRESEQILVLGSTCFAKRYGSEDALGAAHYGNGSSRRLTPEERQLLLENTAAFIERIREEEELARMQAESRLKALRELKAERDRQLLAQRERLAPPAQRPGLDAVKPSPWPWMKPISSLGYFRQSDGSGWVRVQRRDGRQVRWCPGPRRTAGMRPCRRAWVWWTWS